MNHHQQQAVSIAPGVVLPPHSENIEEELHRIRTALTAVFSQPLRNANAIGGTQQNSEWWNDRQYADRYLISFQGTSLAWMVCDRLLQAGMDGTTNTTDRRNQLLLLQQQHFFAAQTLLIKCRSDTHELPLEARPSLRDALVQHLTRSLEQTASTGGGLWDAVTTRLAMALSALAVQIHWTTIVTDLLAANETTMTGTNRRVALAILRALPEECASDRLILPLDKDIFRFDMRDHLVASAHFMFDFLWTSLKTSADTGSVLKVFFIWIRFVPVRPETLIASPLLLPCSIQAVSVSSASSSSTHPHLVDEDDDNGTLMEVAADVLVEVLRMYPSHHAPNAALVQHMIPALLQLPLDEALRSDDEDVVRTYCRLVTEMGESYLSLLLLSSSQSTAACASQIVEGVLRCSRIPDAEIAGLTLHFWYTLIAEIEGLEPFEWRQEVIDVYTTHLLTLVQVCASNLMRFPAYNVADDVMDDLVKHRSYVEETVEDCCRLLGGHAVLQQIDHLLRSEVQAMSSSAGQWQGLESCLACVGAVWRYIPSDESTTLPFCLNLIPQLPPDIRPLRITACTLIGKYASWLTRQPDLLQRLLPYLTQSLALPDCGSAAAMAIKELCGCVETNVDLAEPVLLLYEDIAAKPGRLKDKDELQILEGVCRALSRTIQSSRTDGSQMLSRLAQPIGQRLALLMAESKATPARIILEVDRLTVIVRYLLVPLMPPNTHPVIALVQSLWSFLDGASIRFPQDVALAECICRFHKHVIRTLGAKTYVTMLDALMKQLVESFERTRQSPFLYAASICISEYGKDPTHTQKLFDMVALLSTTFFSFNRNLQELTNHPDVVEEFFYLISKMISFCPDPVITSPLLHSLAQCAVVGMELDHQGAQKGTMKFLDSTVSYGLELREQNKPESQAALERVISGEGQSIVNNLARAMTYELPTYSNQIPEILWKLSFLCRSLVMQWLTTALASTRAAPEIAKTEFMNSLDAVSNQNEFNLAVQVFQKACDRDRRSRRIQQVV